jgi:hypothetical protein
MSVLLFLKANKINLASSINEMLQTKKLLMKHELSIIVVVSDTKKSEFQIYSLSNSYTPIFCFYRMTFIAAKSYKIVAD